MRLKFDPFQFNTTHSNGIPVFWKDIPSVTGFVYIHIIVMAGARQDPIGKEGLAHFLEHTPHNGCKGFPTQQRINTIRNELFDGTLSASTAYEGTEFSCRCSNKTQSLIKSFRFLNSFIFRPTLHVDGINHERKVIIREFWDNNSSSRDFELKRAIQAFLYGEHPMARIDILGSEESISRIDQRDLAQFHSEYYTRDNIKIVIVGDISASTIETVSQFTESVPHPVQPKEPIKLTQSKPRINLFTVSLSKYFGLGKKSIPKNAIIRIYRALPRQNNQEVIHLFTDTLHELFLKEIRGTIGAAYRPEIWTERFSDHTMLKAHMEVGKKTVTEVRNIITRTLEQIISRKQDYVNIFLETKRIALQDKLFTDLSAESIAENAANEISATNHVSSIAEDYAKIKKISFEDIANLAQQELTPEKIIWVIKTP